MLKNNRLLHSLTSANILKRSLQSHCTTLCCSVHLLQEWKSSIILNPRSKSRPKCHPHPDLMITSCLNFIVEEFHSRRDEFGVLLYQSLFSLYLVVTLQPRWRLVVITQWWGWCPVGTISTVFPSSTDYWIRMSYPRPGRTAWRISAEWNDTHI